MINPSDIKLDTLPWLPLEEKTAFPKRPAIYFAIDSRGIVQYIGRTINVCNRWGKHHKYSELSAISNIKIAYLFIDLLELLPEIEKALIEYFNPPLNSILPKSFNASESQTPVNKLDKTNFGQLNANVLKSKIQRIRLYCTALNISISDAVDEAMTAWLEAKKDEINEVLNDND